MPVLPRQAHGRTPASVRHLRLRDRTSPPNPDDVRRPALGFNWDVKRRRQAAAARRQRASSRAARPTCGSRTSTATPGSSSSASARASTPANRIPFVTDPVQPADERDRCRRGHVRQRDRPRRPRLQVPRRSCAATSPTTSDLGFGNLIAHGGALSGPRPSRTSPTTTLNRIPGPTTPLRRPADLRAEGQRPTATSHSPDGTPTRATQWSIDRQAGAALPQRASTPAPSYIYGRSKSMNDGTSSQALSNWRFVYVPGRHPTTPLSPTRTSIPGHRINLAAVLRARGA